jgi:hypothetical protein
MVSRYQYYSNDGQLSADLTDSFSIREVTFGDPSPLNYAEDGVTEKTVAWLVKVNCRKDSENQGNCIVRADNLNGNGPTGPEGMSNLEILFGTRDDAMAFLRFFRK